MCPHFQIPNHRPGIRRLQEVYAVINAHLEEARRAATDTSYRYATKLLEDMSRGRGGGGTCGGDRDDLSEWISYWQGLAMCHPHTAKVREIDRTEHSVLLMNVAR